MSHPVVLSILTNLIMRCNMNRILGPRLGYGQIGLIINSPLVKIVDLYRVTQNVGQNLLLTSNQKFRFGLARPGQAKPSQNGTFVLNVNRRFWPTFCVTLYRNTDLIQGVLPTWPVFMRVKTVDHISDR